MRRSDFLLIVEKLVFENLLLTVMLFGLYARKCLEKNKSEFKLALMCKKNYSA